MHSEYHPWFSNDRFTIFETDKARLRLQNDDSQSLAYVFVSLQLGGDVQRLDLINHGARPAEYLLTQWLRSRHNPPHIGYFYPVRGSPPTLPPDAVVDVVGEPGPEYIRHASGRVYRKATVLMPYVIYRPLPLGESPPAGAVLDHAVGRFGIGAEPPKRE